MRGNQNTQKCELLYDPLRVWIETVPSKQTLALGMPLPAQVHAGLRVGFDGKGAAAAFTVSSEALEDFAYVAQVQLRRQRWLWRGEVFPTGLASPFPCAVMVSKVQPGPGGSGADEVASGLTEWGEQNFAARGVKSRPEETEFGVWESLAFDREDESFDGRQRARLHFGATRTDLWSADLDGEIDRGALMY